MYNQIKCHSFIIHFPKHQRARAPLLIPLKAEITINLAAGVPGTDQQLNT